MPDTAYKTLTRARGCASAKDGFFEPFRKRLGTVEGEDAARVRVRVAFVAEVAFDAGMNERISIGIANDVEGKAGKLRMMKEEPEASTHPYASDHYGKSTPNGVAI